jgi:tripartite-type tricarboxylate transporter receptor subunit TctC
MTRRIVAALAGLVCCWLLASTAQAQAPAATFPSKPVRMFVGYPPGGGVDTAARLVANALNEYWGVPVIVENRAGGTGAVATEAVAKSPKDGYTSMLCQIASHAITPARNKLPYDHIRDFSFIGMIGVLPNVFVVHPSFPAKTLKEFIAMAKTHPGKIHFGSSGVGASPHLSIELFKLDARINIVHVPYKGSAPAITDAVGGHVEMLFAGISSLIPHIQSGRLRPLATGSTRRLPMIPDVATFIELGYPEMTTSVWFGFMAPAATPRDIVAKLSADMDAALKRKDVRDQLIADGQEPGGGTGEEFGEFLRSEIAKYARVIKLAGIKLE